MIGFFPDPYPDELFLSACSRYHHQLKYRSRAATGLDLFGAGRTAVAFDFPCNLDRLIKVLPPFHLYSADRFINDNTLYPLYGPFLPPERARALQEDMRGTGGGSAHGRSGILTSPVRVEFLRYCASCVEEDRERWGETYWHRLHQVPGVKVCPIHHVFLLSSNIPVRYRGRMTYVVAEQAVDPAPVRHLDLSNFLEKSYLKIAEDVAWLLSQCRLIGGPRVIRDRYLTALFQQGLATYPRTVSVSKLLDAFKKHYPAEFLNTLQCGLERRYNWLKRLVQMSKDCVQHPIRHLLLIHFLGYSVEEFFQLPAKRGEPFGSGPWPCLNRGSDHFGQNRVIVCEITTRQKDNRRPEATFRCDCGFTYCRRGPDETPEARFEFSRVKSYGRIWDDTLLRLRNSDRLKIAEIASKLGVTQAIVTNRLAFLNSLSFPANNTSQHQETSQAPPSRGRRAIAVTLDLLTKYRDQWSAAINENPMANRSTIRRKVPSIFNFLYKHDKEWLECNSPLRQKSQGPTPLINRKKQDAELSLEVVPTAVCIKNTHGRPIRASETAIARKLGVLSMIHKRGELLPLTIKALLEVAETPEDYAIRRIEWAAECFRQEGVKPQAWQLQIRAALSNKMAKVPKVKDKISVAVQSFEEN